ncbi:MAG TPA: lipoprotein-releasing system ATP-binding protein LolD [Gammaproteobacteria bacterium]|nr:lipoprotein-releasing system ATP-binding protein LolD [Gammaproteobacteria bacterium]
MNDHVVLECRDLHKSFTEGELDVSVLKGADLKIHRAEKLAIVGPSGCGKSTLLHLLGGLDKADKGEVFIDGESIWQVDEGTRCRMRNRTLGFVYQFHHLLAEFTAQENVAMPLMVGGELASLAMQRAQEMLTLVGLGARLKHKPAQLSGGERQRAAIARALVTRPLCLLADEPTGNLDQATAAQVFELLLRLNIEQQIALVMVTHDRHLAKRMDRILHLDAGQVSQQEYNSN